MLMSKRFAQGLLVLLISFLLAACGSVKIKDFEGQEPEFKIESYFLGETWGWGMVQDYSGKITRQFTVYIEGYMDGDTLVLDEDFVYSDGTEEKRIWRLTPKDENCYTGTAGDVVGEATACNYGNAFHMKYRLQVPIGEREWVFTMDDWMYKQENQVVFNRTRMSKWGITLGHVTLTFTKQPLD
ncbi:Protein of unknown function [Marinospirillum celere]|uniref:DUF3833 domain-containing protein n=1 Tax=Marinospirillum celere TaxID=1122252 RepID=A0A1I1EM75_9GAMM|nr:DUF3833 domain-containing protein [Marinospirillum celere]SFB88201.1 Protein of unknown function [Marinospirillum celere]